MDGSSAPSLAWHWTLFKIWHQGVPQLSSQGPLILMQRLQREAFLFPISLPQDRWVAPFAPPSRPSPLPPGIEAIGHIIDPVDHLFHGIRLDWLMQPLSPVDRVEVKARDHSLGCSQEPGQQQGLSEHLFSCLYHHHLPRPSKTPQNDCCLCVGEGCGRRKLAYHV